MDMGKWSAKDQFASSETSSAASPTRASNSRELQRAQGGRRKCEAAGIAVRLTTVSTTLVDMGRWSATGQFVSRDTSYAVPPLARATLENCSARGGGRGKCEAAGIAVRLTDQTLSCAAKALVTTAERHAACLHLKRAMQTA